MKKTRTKKEMAPVAPGEGNTILRPSAAKNWCFTLNNYSDQDITDLKTKFGSNEFLFGEEVGENGTPHLQGFVCFDKKARPLEGTFSKKIHWEKMKGTKKDNIKYCSKDGKVHTNMETIDDPLKGVELYPFQAEVMKMLENKPDPRKIFWYWESEGCTGKTSLAVHICLKYERALYCSGKAADIKCAIALLKKPPTILIFDCVRSAEKYISYEAIEAVKNRIMFSGKYESKMMIFNIPHVICFANFEPERERLSKDRWEVKCIGLSAEGVTRQQADEELDSYLAFD